jgi:hexosaminidase
MIRSLPFFSLCAFLLFSCAQPESDGAAYQQLIPLADAVTLENGSFTLQENASYSLNGFSEQEADSFDKVLTDQASIHGLALTKASGAEAVVQLTVDPSLANEAYLLEINTDGISLKGGSPAGVYFAWQTLRQTLILQADTEQPLNLRAVRISDQPTYNYRSVMLDVARHFFDAPNGKRTHRSNHPL